MAIVAYVGVPGSGKSYSVVTHVLLPAIRSGRSVVTNIPINISELPEDQRGLVTIFDLLKFTDDQKYFETCVIPGSILCIDEAWRWLPSGMQSNRIPEHFKKLLAEHRHFVDADGRSTDICLVTQDLSQLASFPRQLIEKTYRTVKLLALGTRSRFRVDIYEGAVTGGSPPKSKLLSKSHLQKYLPENYKFYKSHTHSQSSESGAIEVNADTRGAVFGGLLFKVGIPLALVALCFGIYGALGFFTSHNKNVDAAPVSPTTINPSNNQKKSVPVQDAPILPAAPVLSAKYRISGFTGYSDGKGFIDSHSTVLIDHGTRAKPSRFPFLGNCHYTFKTETRSIQCVFNGELVTFYSGSNPEKNTDLIPVVAYK